MQDISNVYYLQKCNCSILKSAIITFSIKQLDNGFCGFWAFVEPCGAFVEPLGVTENQSTIKKYKSPEYNANA